MKAKEKLHEMIDNFLAERRKSVGGKWGNPQDGDIEELDEIIKTLIEIKFAPDYQGESAVGWRTWNKRKGHVLLFRDELNKKASPQKTKQ